MAKNTWLMKSEPDAFSIDDLKKQKTSLWDGVRNYQARNFMMNDMKKGDAILFYHSRVDPIGIAGIAKVTKTAVPDPTQFNKKSKYFEKRATKEKPVWYCVEVGFVRKFKRTITLQELKENPKLSNMRVIQKGQRLSIQPVTESEYKTILGME